MGEQLSDSERWAQISKEIGVAERYCFSSCFLVSDVWLFEGGLCHHPGLSVSRLAGGEPPGLFFCGVRFGWLGGYMRVVAEISDGSVC